MSCQDCRSGSRVPTRLVLGIFVMMLGLVLALDSLGIVDGSHAFRFWPLILIAVGATKWISPTDRGSSGFVWVVAGVAALFVTLGRMPSSRFWAALLFFVGANIVWRALRPGPHAAAGDPASHLDMTAILGGAKTVSYAADFTGGQAIATLGGCELDLRHAVIREGGVAVIDAFAFWGGVEIKVPEEWEVVNQGSAFLGGFDNKTRPIAGASRRLVVTGIAIMGGVEIKN